MADQPLPSLGEAVATLKLTDGSECKGEARTLTMNSMIVVLEAGTLTEATGIRSTQCAHLSSSILDSDVDVICKVQGQAVEKGRTVVRLRVIDWIGLREQLPPAVRELFSLRDQPRHVPANDSPIHVHFTLGNGTLDEEVNMFDLSLHGVSVLAPAIWFDRLDPGDEVKVGFKLRNHPFSELFGVVRHIHFEDTGRQAGLSWENRRLLVGVAFDSAVTPDFVRKHQPIQKFLGSVPTR